MTTNLEELKNISRTALLGELNEKTKKCGLLWNLIRPGVYKATNSPYDFHLTKVNGNTCVLDVTKNGTSYRSYNSSIVEGVSELFDTVDVIAAQAEQFEKLKVASRFLGQIPSCRASVYRETMHDGLIVSGSAMAQKLSAISLTMLPTTLTFGPTLFPWSGFVTSIDDPPNATSHDGDATYIRQQVSGALPTQWGYAYIGFNMSALTFSGPYRFNVKVAHRREAQAGVTIFIDVIANSTLVFSSQHPSTNSYSVSTTGNQFLPSDMLNLTDLTVRLSMFTNTGNEEPRALRVSAVDITILGYNAV
jgi:hypothetical protein